MDPTMAAERVVGYLVPYALEKTAELAKKIGKDAVDKIGGWLDRLRKGWADDDDASAVLTEFDNAPLEKMARLKEILADRMVKDETLARSAEQLAADIGPTVVVVMRGGEVEVQHGAKFGSIRRGNVHLDQELKSGKEMYGPEFGDVG